MRLILHPKFIDRVINTWGDVGQQWLNELPKLVKKIGIQWQLNNIQSINNMSYNFVAFAKQGNRPVVIKLSCDSSVYHAEKKALGYFNGHGSIQLLDTDDSSLALLLDQAAPGITLKSAEMSMTKKINAYAGVANQLASVETEQGDYKHAYQWCEAIDRLKDPRVPVIYIDKANRLRQSLLASAPADDVCHGDLHFDNIIQQGVGWVSIDPKGILGEKAFEVAAFDLITDDERGQFLKDQALLIDRLKQLAKATNIDLDRLIAWVYLRCMISAQWFLEDNGDATARLKEIKILYKLIR